MFDKNLNQEQVNPFPIIGKPAPSFTANTTHGQINFPEDYKGRWVILFSHPSDFTPVCTTEFMTFSTYYDEFQELDTDLIGLSIDSIHSHLAWVNAIEGYTWKDIVNPTIQFPIIEDLKMEVASKYGMLQGESDTSAVRAVFFIDPEGTMRTILYYPASLGRNFEEIKRIILGLQKADAESIATPADWQPGEDVIVPAPSTTEGIEERVKEAEQNNYNMVDWYLSFKEDK